MAKSPTAALPLVLQLVLSLVILAGGGLGFAALWASRESAPREPQDAKIPTVTTTQLAPYSGAFDLMTDGTVVPSREVTLSAEVAGKIVWKNEECRAGSYVTAGTPLLRIDPSEYDLKVRQLASQLEQAKSNVTELGVEINSTENLIALSERELELQEREVRRISQLYERGVSTDAEKETAERNLIKAENALATLRNQASLLVARKATAEYAKDLVQAQLEEAELDRERTEISAPVSGMIVSEPVEKDSYANIGANLLTIEHTDEIEVKTSLKMSELYWIWSQLGSLGGEIANRSAQRDYQIPETPVTVSYQLAGQTFTWDGTLSRFEGGGIDERTRTVPCRVKVPDPRKVQVGEQADDANAQGVGITALVRGMFVQIKIHVKPQVPLWSIPAAAVRPGNAVWWLDEQGKVHRQTVRVAKELDDEVLIHRAGQVLTNKTKIITSPVAQLVDGMTVQEVSEK